MRVLKRVPSRRVWLAAPAALACLSALAGQDPSAASDEHFARGVRLQTAGDLAGACRAYEEALKLSPRRVDALSNLGLAYGALRQYDQAIQSFEKALAVDSKQPTVLFNLGLTYLEAGQDENARRTLRAAAANPDNLPARHYLGVALLRLGRVAEGVRELETVVAARPENLEAVYTLASAYLAAGQIDKAQPLVDRIISRQDAAEAHLITGVYRMAAHNYPEAVAEFRRARELNPVLPDVGLRLGSAYAMTGSRETAAQLFEEHLKKNPSDFEALIALGWLRLDANRLDEAGIYLKRAAEIRPKDLEVPFQLARVARAQGRLEEAAGLLERVVEAQPDHVRAHVLLAQIYLRLKRTADSNREREIVRRLAGEENAAERAEPAPAAGGTVRR